MAIYDPEDLFHGITAAGSEAWTVAADGRMCRPSLTWDHASVDEVRLRILRLIPQLVMEVSERFRLDKIRKFDLRGYLTNSHMKAGMRRE